VIHTHREGKELREQLVILVSKVTRERGAPRVKLELQDQLELE